MTSPVAELVVQDDAIRRNAQHFVALTGGRLLAVPKADAFGHGEIARSVLDAGASAIGVTSVAEALTLRASGIDAPLLSWLNPVHADFAAAITADVDLAVPSPDLMHAIGRAARRVGSTARVHLHIDVGMARDGCPTDEWAILCALAREHLPRPGGHHRRRPGLTGPTQGHDRAADKEKAPTVTTRPGRDG